MPEFDESGGMLPGTSAVNVDVSGLDGFAGSVEAELTANFQPQAVRLMRIYQLGSHFGVGHASADVAAARRRHNECLRAATEQLVEYARATEVLIQAARTVAARYRESDAFAAANALEVQRELDSAVKALSADWRSPSAQATVSDSTGPDAGGGRHE